MKQFLPTKWSTFRYLRSLICVTKNHKLCVYKKEKIGKELSMVFFHIIADAICLLTAITHTAVFFLHYYRASLCYLSFVMLAKAIRPSGALNTDFLSFCHVSFCHLSLSRVSVSYISLCCRVFFFQVDSYYFPLQGKHILCIFFTW